MNELTDSMKKTLIQRMNTPLFGFIVLSWFSFNWDGFLIVLMGDGELQGRVAKVKAENFTFLYSLVYPVVCGFFLTIIFPYANSAVSFIQRHSQKLIHENDIERVKAESAVKEKIAEYNAKDNNILKHQELIQERMNKEIELATTEVTTEIEAVRKESSDLKQRNSELNEKIEAGEIYLNNLKENIEPKEKQLAGLERNIERVSAEWSQYYNNKINFDNVVRIFKYLERSVYDETFKAGFEQYGEDLDADSTRREEISHEEAMKMLKHIHSSCRRASKEMADALNTNNQ